MTTLIDTLKRQYAITQDEQTLVVLRDALVEQVPDLPAPLRVDTAKTVSAQIAEVQERWHSVSELKETAKRHLREDAGLVKAFVLARIKATQKYTGVFAGDVVLVSTTPEPNPPVPLTPDGRALDAVAYQRVVAAADPAVPVVRYFRKYRVAYAPADDFEILSDEVAVDQPEPQPQMKIELKKFVANQKFSEETLMFRAEIWIDGKRAGEVENEGRGGSNSVHYNDPTMGDRVRAWLHAQPPLVGEFDADGHLASETGRIPNAYVLDEDLFFGELAEQQVKKKDDARIERALQKDAAKFRAKGLAPWKFSLRGPRGESFVVLGLKADQKPEAAAQMLAKKYKSTVVGSEAL